MCTLVLLQRPGELLAISGNRNELLTRPASTMMRHGDVLAPRDDAAGGTWLGLNARGLFVVITNRTGAVLDRTRRSRGLLVRDALKAASARELHDQLQALDAAQYNGFHLIYADLRDAFITWGDGAQKHHLTLQADHVHVVTERSFGAGEAHREHSVRAAYARLAPDVHAWRAPMTTHAGLPLESACVHADAVGYGTRSSLQLLLRPNAAEGLWTDGHPCVNAARDLAPLLSSFP